MSSMLGQFLITVPIYLVKSTSSDETSPADITNMGLVYNTIFTSFPGNG